VVFRPIDLYVITSTFFTFLTFFFQNPKNVTFCVFCRVSYVFSNNTQRRFIVTNRCQLVYGFAVDNRLSRLHSAMLM